MLLPTVTLLVVAVALWLWWRWKHTSIFLELGIPGPKPNLLFGNLIELYAKGPLKCKQQWVKKYGRVLGYYLGMHPVIIIADPEMVKTVLIKDFSNFSYRVSGNPLRSRNSRTILSKSVLFLNGQRWKEIRSLLTPTFTTSKMKKMAPLVHSSVELLMSKIEEASSSGHEFDIHDFFQRLSMDVILRTAFGAHFDVQKPKYVPSLVKSARLLFTVKYTSFLNFIGSSFPGLRAVSFQLRSICQALKNKGFSPMMDVFENCKNVVKTRRSNSKDKYNDLLQMMLDASMSYNELSCMNDSKLTAGNAEAEVELKTGEIMKGYRHYLTDEEVIGNCAGIFLAGYETTSTALSFTAHLLVHHPDIQDKIHDEIKKVLQHEGKLDYNSVNQLQYLDQVFNESMRIYPPVIHFVNRRCTSSVRYGNIAIPKDMRIEIPVYIMHHDPEFWPDPETFDPDRFSSKPNSSGITFLPFGGGPRNCLGMRFAQMEAKMTLANILHRFKLVPGEKTVKQLKVSILTATETPSHGVWLKAVPWQD